MKNSYNRFGRWNRRRIFNKDTKAVTEAIGTVFLLGISISLVSIVFVWVNSLTDFDDARKLADLTIHYENDMVSIEHRGGEILLDGDTDILIRVDLTANRYSISDAEGELAGEFDWGVGQTWNKTFSAPSTAEIYVAVFDLNSNTRLVGETVQVGQGIGNLADLSVRADNITIEFDGNNIKKDDLVNITAKITNEGFADANNVLVRFYDGAELLSKNNRQYQLVNVSQGGYNTTWIHWFPPSYGVHVIHVKIFYEFSELNYANNYATKDVNVDVILPEVHGSDLKLTTYDILFDNSNPTHGTLIKVTILVHNEGDQAVLGSDGATLIVRDTRITWAPVDPLTDKPTFTDGVHLNQTFYNVTIPVSGYTPYTFWWSAMPGGTVYVYAFIDANNSVPETEDTNGLYESNNLAIRAIQILPKILLVDDDGASSGSFDTTGAMRDSLTASGVVYDNHYVTGTTDPEYDSGSHPLQDYDIVIWMTGYNSNTLTQSNINALGSAMKNGTYLWMISQDILNDTSAVLGDPDTGDFGYDFLGVDSYSYSGTPEILEGMPGDVITNGTSLNTSGMLAGQDRGINITFFKKDSLTDDINGILKNDTMLGYKGNTSLRYLNQTHGFKVVFFGWEFSSLIEPTDRADLTFKVLQWFNWTLTLGTDFAVASEEFSTLSPRYLERIWINASIRNNGVDTATVDIAVYITGPDGEEKLVPKFPDNQANPFSVTIPGNGGELTVAKQWLAISVGLHNFRVMVDPFDLVDEVSETNNDISYSNLAVTQLLIQYTILLVDDDNSTNNGGGDYNVTLTVGSALTDIDYDYDLYRVVGGMNPGSGPDVDTLKHYNSVIWITGNDTGPTLDPNDQQSIVEYIRGLYFEAQYLEDVKVNFWLIGQHILADLELTNATFISEILQVTAYTKDTGLPNFQEGVHQDDITHGIVYPIDPVRPDYGDTITPSAGATGILYQNRAAGTFNSLRFNDTLHRLIFMPWIYPFIFTPGGMPAGETYQAELAFLIMQWFAYPELRIELKTSIIDIAVSDSNPVIGDSYIIRTALYNYGGNDTSTVVRFLDGSTIIDTQAVYVPAGGSSATEVIWTPLFAGKRNLKVSVDPQNDVPEIFERLNNNATRRGFDVFYFYDDLENGTGNWKHDSTIIHITGESPLDYIDPPVYSNVSFGWNQTETGGFLRTTRDYHSYDSSFYTFEPEATLSLVFVLNNNDSMSGDIEYMKQAFNYTIDNLSADDRVAIYTFNTTSNPAPYDPFAGTGGPTLLSDIADEDNGFIEIAGNYTCPVHSQAEDGIDILKHLVNLIDAAGGVGTPLWETMNSAIDLAYDYGRGVPAVIALTDSNETEQPTEGPEGPWAVAPPDNDFNGNDGNTADDWSIAKNYDVTKSPMRVYTVGLKIPGGKNSDLGFALREAAESSNGTFTYTINPQKLTTNFLDAIDHLEAVTQARAVAKTFFTDDFETGLTKWQTTSGWGRDTGQSVSGSWSAYSDNNEEGDLITIDIDLSDALDARLEFYFYLTSGVDAGTDFLFYLYDGSSWGSAIADLGSYGEDSWVRYAMDLDLVTYGNANFKVRFDSNLGQQEKIYLDDVRVWGNESSGPASQPGPGQTSELSLWGAGDRNLTTESFDLLGVSSAKLSFYQKYDIKSALNGVVIQVGTFNGTGWNYKYLLPNQPYTSNYNLGYTRYDDFGTDMRWCFNGVSGFGLYTWDYIEADLTNYTGQSNLRVRLLYMWSTWGDGGVYFIDDFKIRVTRNETTSVTSQGMDQWEYTTNDAHSGSYSWWIRNPSTGNLSGGLDNSLYTRPIDLTGARNASLSAYFKFNVNASAGRPPDGFRVEISSDNGVSWKAINLGVRTAWGVSGNDSDASDGVPGDGKSYTGLDPDGDRWVEANTLSRLNVDISGWAGSVVMLRFRVVTASDNNPDFDNHYEWGQAGFGGFYVDDLIVSGFSLLG